MNRVLLAPGLPTAAETSLLRQAATITLAGVVAEGGVEREGAIDDIAGVKPILFRLSGGIMRPNRDQGTALPANEHDRSRYQGEFRSGYALASRILSEHDADWVAVTVRLLRDKRLTGTQVQKLLRQRGPVVAYRIRSPEGDDDEG